MSDLVGGRRNERIGKFVSFGAECGGASDAEAPEIVVTGRARDEALVRGIVGGEVMEYLTLSSEI